MSYKNIECAIALADEAEAMFWWPDDRWSPVRWDRESQVYREFVSNAGYVVRAAAARALGELFWGCNRKSSAAFAPAISDMMQWVQAEEQRQPGVAGPFLEGSHWSSGEVPEAFPCFDFRAWFLETLRTSSASEPQLPNMLSLEFYAHEYFCGDPEAIEAMLEMGRFKLAVLTATEEPANIELLADVLEKMREHDDPRVARAIATYLAQRDHHAGHEFMSEP